MDKATKSEIYDLVLQCTLEFCSSQKLNSDSATLGERLNISRSLASQYLNEYFKDGTFIKISTRPVYFLDKKTVEKSFRIDLKSNEFYDVNELIQLVEKGLLAQKSFLQAIGHDTSLAYCIMQCQSAIKYPPNGLPILLYGEHGVGKTYLSHLIYQYALEERIIPDDAKLMFLHEADSNLDDYKKIFGSIRIQGDKKLLQEGLLAKAKNGILVIDHAETLSDKCYRQLMSYMKSGDYTVENYGTFHSATRLVMTSCVDPKENIDSLFLHNVPILCQIPSLEERPLEDKEAFVIHFLKEEEENLRKQIYISSKAFAALIEGHYKNNIEELIGCIKTSCANAYLASDQAMKKLEIYLYHLPVSAISTVLPVSEEENLICVDQTINHSISGKLLSYFDYMLELFHEYEKGNLSDKQFSEKCFEGMNQYYDYIVFERKYTNPRVSAYEKLIVNIFENMLDQYDIYIPANCAFVIARIIYNMMQMVSSIKAWELKNKESIQHLLNCLKQNYAAEASVAVDVQLKIRQTLDIELNMMNLAFLILNIQFYNREMNRYLYNCMVLAHGYSTASSIADAANKLVGSHVMDAIDMPLNTSVDELICTLRKYIRRRNQNKDLILMVDMGSLEDIGNQISDIANMRIGVINNVSTKIAVNIAYKVKQGLEMNEIFSSITKETYLDTKIISNVKRKKAIIFTSETGETAAERVVQLFKNSLPRPVDISIFTYDYYRLSKNLDDDEVFVQFDVIFVAGTIQLPLTKVAYVSLEDVIAFKDIDRISLMLTRYFSEAEAEQFNKNLVKNFTLENVMNYLTILNPDKLITYIEAALSQLQNLMGIMLPNKTMVGMYIHISCLVERLITKDDSGKKLAEAGLLNKDEKRFVKMFNESFTDLLNHYRVVIPLNEILYLYEYIFKDLGI